MIGKYIFNKLETGIGVVSLSLILLLSIFTINSLNTAPEVSAMGSGNCYFGGADAKKEDSPFSITAPTDKVIKEVKIKAGIKCYGPYTSDGTYEFDRFGPNRCYQIEGIGTQTVNVKKVGIGYGYFCQDISHIEVIWEDPASSPTPTPGCSHTPTPTPTPSESPTPTPTPSESPRPTPTPEESPTPTPVDEDVCANIDGIQTSVPGGLHLDASGRNCVDYEYGGPSDSSNETGGGQVLGASDVLGLSDTSSGSVSSISFFFGLIVFTLGIKETVLNLQKKQ